MIHILTVKLGEKYGPQYVNRLNQGIQNHSSYSTTMHCLTDDPRGLAPDINVVPFSNSEWRQWAKLMWHSREYQSQSGIEPDDECIILDIDQIVVGNFDPILWWDPLRDEVAVVQRWWSRRQHHCKINGGFQKFRAGTTTHLAEIFLEQPDYWMQHYINLGQAVGPVNGEQNFLDQHIEKKSYIPSSWIAKYDPNYINVISQQWLINVDPVDPFLLGNDFHQDIKLVHFSNADNLIENCNEPWIREYWHD